MAAKTDTSTRVTGTKVPERVRQPPEQRERISKEGRRWAEENAEAAEAWAKWADKNGVPLPPQF